MGRRKVLLLKSLKDDDPYIALLQQSGFVATCLPVLSFHYVNLDQLQEKLLQTSAYHGMLLTSQNTIEALKLVSKNVNCNILNNWATKRNFCVGVATAEKAREIGLTTEGQETGNAAALQLYIQQALKPGTDSRLLYPKTNLKTTGLSDSLESQGYCIDCLTVYETGPDKNIDCNLQSYIQTEGIPDFVVFFSPSCVTFSLRKILEVTKGSQFKILAIGPSTSAELKQSNQPSHTVVSQPNPESLLKALQLL